MTTFPNSMLWLLLSSALYPPGVPTRASQQGANNPGAVSSRYRIAGTVVSKADGHALVRARVTVTDVKDAQKFQTLVTSENGRFEFGGLPAGKYSLTGAKRGFISTAYDQHDQFNTAIVTGAGLDTETLTLRVAPDAVITGKVLDEAGEPVRHAMVTLYYVDHSSGVDEIQTSRVAQTDDQGTYEVTPLLPGTYYMSANAKPWYAIHPNLAQGGSESDRRAATAPTVDRSLDMTYPLTYYPDVTEAESATPIPVRGGDRLQVDIHLNPVPSLRLLFRVPDEGKNGFSYPQLQQQAFDGLTLVRTDGVQRVSPGLLEVTGIPAGRYNIRLAGAGETIQMNGVDLIKDGEEVDTSKGESLGSVKVSVQVPNEPALPERLMVGLRSGHGTPLTWQVIDPKGQAEMQQIPPGRHEVLVQAPGKRYTIARMQAEGAQVSGHTLILAAGSSPALALTLAGGNAEVEGTAKRDGKAFAGAMVVLVPKNPEMNRDLFRRDQSDLDGTFVLHGVIPGTYTLLAIDNGWDLDWSQPGVIAAYLKHGRIVQVGDQSSRPINIAEPIEVQLK
jgi:Carboxypeptidase regulatory-like domain